MKDEAAEMSTLLKQKKFIPGTVYLMKTKCGKPGCHCATKGQLHEAWCFSQSYGGKTRIKCLSPKDLSEYRELTGFYRRFRLARAKIGKLHLEQVRLVNILEGVLEKEALARRQIML
jgi:hypothetical protein